MHWVRVLLLVYVSVLSGWPCADGRPDNYGRETAVIQPSSHVHEHGVCSPFCTCGCCGVVIGLRYDLVTYQKPLVPLVHTDEETGYAFRVPDSTLDTIWQPPKFIA